MARAHPDWLVGPAGHNWGDDLVGLDLTHPGVRAHLAEVLGGLRDLGVDYAKLDFLYAGALPGRRHDGDAGPLDAYRSGLALVREVLGPDRVMYAMDYPYQYVPDEVRWMDDLDITPAQKIKFFQTNAERWFKL